MTSIAPPPAGEDHGFYNNYISLTAPEPDLITALEHTHDVLAQLIASLHEEQLYYRYEPGKWDIPETMQHLIDAERNFCYRIMRISRGDQGQVPALDVNNAILNGHVSDRSIQGIMDEYAACRRASVIMFREMPEAMLDMKGPARDAILSVRALGFAMAGHTTHHTNIICERYLAANN
jgi:hypothetical protein